jgi:hypothetical protein
VGGRRGPTFDVTRARELYETGMTAQQVGDVLGVSEDAICTHLSRLGVIRPGPPKKPMASTQRIVQMRDAGLTWREVGATVGMTGESAHARYWAAKGIRRVPGHPSSPPSHLEPRSPSRRRRNPPRRAGRTNSCSS